MKRPTIITIICVFGYLSALFTFPQVFSPGIKKIGIWIPAVYGLIVSANFIACVGLWYMKQWGVLFFIVSVFAKILFYILTSQTGITFYIGIFVSAASIFFIAKYYTRLSPNL